MRPNTARVYLARVFDKTGVNRRDALMTRRAGTQSAGWTGEASLNPLAFRELLQYR